MIEGMIREANDMIQNTHWKQLARNWASILFGNALYSLAVALFL